MMLCCLLFFCYTSLLKDIYSFCQGFVLKIKCDADLIIHILISIKIMKERIIKMSVT